jgi:hypothetical protein
MAGHGPAPSDPDGRRRRNAAPSLTVIEADGASYGPDLPVGTEWPDVTRDWWETWRQSAQASTFTDTDWSFLLDTAVLHMEFWDGNMAVASELRLRVAKFGATPEDRARLRIEVAGQGPKSEPRKREPAARTRRDGILRAVGDD